MAEGTYRVQCVATRDSGVPEDVAVIDMGWYHAAGYTRATFAALGPIDESLAGVGALSVGEQDPFLDDYETFLNSLNADQGANTEWTDIKVYRTDNARPIPNSPNFQRTVSYVGDDATPLPPQVAVSVSLATGSRRHWGRFYVPSPSTDTQTGVGRISSGTCDRLAAAYDTLCNNLSAIDVYPVVFSATGVNAAANSVYKVQVDNVYDVIRRRRFDKQTYAKVYDFR